MPVTDILPQGSLLALMPLSGELTPIIAPYSARGITQTLELLKGSGPNAWLRRDVNGVLRSIADTRFRKYKSVVTCKDGNTPCIDNAWIGEIVEVNCAIELSYPVGGSPTRPVVPGSTRVEDHINFYRPQLIMLVADIRLGFPEWSGLYDWQIDLEEQ